MSDESEPTDWWVTCLQPVVFDRFWALAVADKFNTEPIEDPVRRQQHLLALSEMHELVQEARYELGLATRLQYLFRTAVEAGHASSNVPARPPGFDELGLGDDALAMPPAVLLLLADAGSSLPRPASLWDNPHQHMSHHRVLSLWLSAQMVDSAVVRILAALDRLATALHFALSASASPKLPERRGVTMFPTFDADQIERMAYRYGDSPEIKTLRKIAQAPLMSAGREMRDFFIHRGRWRSAGHSAGARSTLEGIQHPLREHEHLALGAALFDQVLRPGVEAGAALLVRRRAELGFDPDDLGT